MESYENQGVPLFLKWVFLIMKSTVATVLISGAGQLGSRYLQGLAKSRAPLRIYIHDISEESLGRAEQRWNDVFDPVTHHVVSFHSSLESLPRQLDIAIIATTADVRPLVVGEISSFIAVRFWVLEKVLAQSESGIDEIMSRIGGGSNAWVNTPRRMMPWHKQIKSQLGLNHPMSLKFEGGLWGMACNAVHIIDLFAWWTGETLQDVSTDRLNQYWFESKRQGNWEVSGTLEARFSGGALALLSAREGEGTDHWEVSDAHLTWRIKEAEGLASRSDGLEIPGRITYQSEMSASLVESILESGSCDLPTLEESAAMHRIFIRSMLEHWMRAGDPAAIIVPIT